MGLDEAVAFEPTQEGIDGPFSDDGQASSPESLGHLVAVRRPVTHHRQEAQVEDASKELAPPALWITHAPQATVCYRALQGTLTPGGAGDRQRRRDKRMSAMTRTEAPPVRAADSHWAVETHGLTKRFGDTVAVNGVELLIPRGVAFGYLGPNGAGKTTLIRVLLGLTHADAGTMSLLGHPVPRQRAAALARVGPIVDEPRFHGHLTGRQNLRILAAAREPAAKDRIAPALERVGILHRADDRVSKYSMGMRRRRGVPACLLGDPQLLILDEPMNGLDPAGMHEMRDMILSLVAEGRTVVLSSHLLDEVERTCEAVAIVDRGRVIRQGPIAQLLAGASFEVQVECSDPERARTLLERTTIGAQLDVGTLGLGITLPA